MTTTAPLLEEVAARLPTTGEGRAAALDLYDRHHEAEDLAGLSSLDFLHVLRRAREDWDHRQAVKIAALLTRYTTSRKGKR